MHTIITLLAALSAGTKTGPISSKPFSQDFLWIFKFSENCPKTRHIVGNSGEKEFAGFSREELGIHSNLEVEEYDEDDDLDDTAEEIHDDIAVQVVYQE